MGWLKDPLVLFVVLGGVLAALHLTLRSEPPVQTRETEIVVTDADVTHIRRVYEKTWQRPPTDARLRALIERRVRDEILYREAMALGLGQGDSALRRRLALKLEFLARDAGGAATPTEAELRVFLEENAASYTSPGYRSFIHVFVSEAKRGERAEADANALLERLKSDQALDPLTLGNRTMLEAEQVRVSHRDVTAIFGGAFADGVFEQPVGVWSGPLRSGYGLHLVLVREDVRGSLPTFPEARARLERDLIDRRGDEALAAYVQALREKYDVSILPALGSDGDE